MRVENLVKFSGIFCLFLSSPRLELSRNFANFAAFLRERQGAYGIISQNIYKDRDLSHFK